MNRLQNLRKKIQTSTGYISPSQMFDEAFGVFKDEQTRCESERTSDLSRKRQTLGAEQAFKGSAVPYAGRHILYQEHAALLGQDFLHNLLTIIIPNCSLISDEQTGALVTLLHEQFTRAANGAKESEARLAASQGITHNLESIARSVEGIYSGEESRVMQRINSQVRQANLKERHTDLQNRKQLFSRAFSRVFKFILGRWYPQA